MSRTYHGSFSRRIVEDPDAWRPCGTVEKRCAKKKARAYAGTIPDGEAWRKLGGRFVAGHADWSDSAHHPFLARENKYPHGKRVDPDARSASASRRRKRLSSERNKIPHTVHGESDEEYEPVFSSFPAGSSMRYEAG